MTCRIDVAHITLPNAELNRTFERCNTHHVEYLACGLLLSRGPDLPDEHHANRRPARTQHTHPASLHFDQIPLSHTASFLHLPIIDVQPSAGQQPLCLASALHQSRSHDQLVTSEPTTCSLLSLVRMLSCSVTDSTSSFASASFAAASTSRWLGVGETAPRSTTDTSPPLPRRV